MIGLWRKLLGSKTPGPIPDALWRSVTGKLRFLDHLSIDECARLHALSSAFLAEKEFTAAGGLELSDEICLSIAVQGCLPILNLGLDWYRGWQGVIVYPDEFVIPREIVDSDGVVHRYDEVAAGEAWGDGPMIVSWTDAQMTEGEYNVVIHEFAHKIDMLNGDADGHPPLQKNMSHAAWEQVWSAAYRNFCDRVDHAPMSIVEDEHGEAFEELTIDSALDPYAAEAPGEFFAVVSEVFFTAPDALQAEYPGLYEQLVLLYRQDPAGRLTAPSA